MDKNNGGAGGAPAKKKFKMPHTYVILYALVIIIAICTYIVPAGVYDTYADPVSGRTIVDPDSYHTVEKNPTTPFGLLMALPNGLVNAASIVFFIFIVGGSFQIVTATRAIEKGISSLARRLNGKERLIIPIIVFIFSLGGATFGMAEECIVFIPMGIALARALGYDAIVGSGIVILGAATGFTSAWMNPFTVGVAQTISELPMFSGIFFRLIIWVVVMAATIIYIWRYAAKVKAKPELSYVYELEKAEKGNAVDMSKIEKMGTSDILVLLSVLAGLAMIIVGVFLYDWYIMEIAAMFFGIGILSGIFSKMGPSTMASEFVKGAAGIAFGALVVGVARAILVVMQDANIIHTVVHGLASLISGLPKTIAAVIMMLVQTVINFFIPSGSGQASVTMPIMAPLADVLGMTRQTAVLAFQFGDGFTNSIIPTGAIMASLAMGNIPYDKWVKFVWKLIALWTAIAAVFMVIAVLINYGPH